VFKIQANYSVLFSGTSAAQLTGISVQHLPQNVTENAYWLRVLPMTRYMTVDDIESFWGDCKKTAGKIQWRA
jgi:hypothetical protein